MKPDKRTKKTDADGAPLAVRRDKGKIWSHIRSKWLVETPEETVRQQYLLILVNEYGFSVDQIDEEVEMVIESARDRELRAGTRRSLVQQHRHSSKFPP